MFNHVIRAFRGDHELAHDSAVETWMHACCKDAKGFDSEGALIGFCLFKVEKMAIDLIRKRREITGCGELIEAIEVHDEGDRIREQARHELARARARLPRFERQIIDLYYEESLSDREIAERLMSPSRGGDACRKSIQRARRAAEKSMRPWLEESGLDADSLADAFPSLN
jgi:RNA polymerase sigma factor (sigma-70 family)